MDDMKELIDLATAHRLMLILAVAAPILGLAIGAVYGWTQKRLLPCALRGLAVGSLGILNFGLWHLYNAVTARLGLDTVRNLLVNAAIFIAVGAALGVGIGLAVRSKKL